MKPITGRLTEKAGKWYAVINLYTTEGKRKEKWIGLDLEAKKGSKTEANRRLNEILAEYNSGKVYLMENLSKAEQQKRRVAELPLHEYLVEWLDEYKHSIAPTTYSTYQGMIEARMIPYFEELNISIKDVTGDELNAYYNYLMDQGLSGCTAQKHHNLLHLAFKHAMKKRIIPYNPCDQANRPKAVKYVANYYNESKLKDLLMALKDDPLRIVVMLTIYYGVRRSEVLGIKWSAIDEDEELIHLRHKVIEDKSNGKTVIRGMDIMKSKSSMRSLPLMTFIREELRKERERQEEMKQVLRGSYNRQYEDYVCVDAMGNLFKPNYVTNHFAVLLRQHGLDKIRFHDLRHSCATLMLSNGEDMKKIQAWLGHSTIVITADTYAHLDAQSKRGSASVIENALAITA